MHVFEQSQQIQEKGGRPATESACQYRSSLSKKQQLKAQIIYHHLPSFQENILNRSTQIRVQPHSSCLWHFPNPPCLHMHLRARPFRHPAARACHNTWERESRRKQMADGGAHFHWQSSIRVKWVGAPALQKTSVLRGAVARTAARSKCHLHDSRAISGRAKQRTKNQLEQAGFLLCEMNSSGKKNNLKVLLRICGLRQANTSLSSLSRFIRTMTMSICRLLNPVQPVKKVHSILIRTRSLTWLILQTGRKESLCLALQPEGWEHGVAHFGLLQRYVSSAVRALACHLKRCSQYVLS